MIRGAFERLNQNSHQRKLLCAGGLLVFGGVAGALGLKGNDIVSRVPSLVVQAECDEASGQPGSGVESAYVVSYGDDAKVERIRRQVEENCQKYIKAHGVPGLSVAVSYHGRTLLKEGYGLSDIENSIKMHPDTCSRVASVSKAMSAVVCGMLLEQGRLDFEKPIREYYPQYTAKGEEGGKGKVKVRHLLSHTGGIRHYERTMSNGELNDGEDERHSMKRYNSVEEAVQVFRDESLLCEPGSGYTYTTHGFTLLTRVMELASGQEFTSLMSDFLFKRLGMKSTRPDKSEEIVPHRSRYYTKNPKSGKIENSPYVDISMKWGGGGYTSTTGDMIRFGNAVIYDQILKPATKELLFTPQRLTNGKPLKYGLGWSVLDSKNEKDGSLSPKVVFHSGAGKGASSLLLLVPESKIVIAMVCNLEDEKLLREGLKISKLIKSTME
eukprot:Nk52_evm1s304 gene=Nk52_evmTU1s304